MGAYKYLNELYKNKQSDALRFLLRVRAWEFRQLPQLVRVNHPSRPEKARRLGFKAKQGFVVYRIRVKRGMRKRPYPGGNPRGKPASAGIHLTQKKSLQTIAEARAGKRLGALRLLSSYWVNQDAKYKWYEVIFVDPMHEAIRMDPQINWIVNAKHKHREMRGKTSAGRRSRGLQGKGYGFTKMRPSQTAAWKRYNTVKFARKR